MTKRILVIALLAVAVALVVPTAAMANFAIHGNYLNDTDACAGCHRAHSSVSSLEWQNAEVPGAGGSALLVGSATRMIDFCYACHDGTSQGADTNVQEGIYEGDLYGSQDSTLNGGGFETMGITGAVVTSTHVADGAPWGAYGGGYFGEGDGPGVGGRVADGQDPNANLGETAPITMDCTTCHDPHGSANYRILKAVVFGNNVGGYVDSGNPDDPTPDGFVASTEEGWPVGGFHLHQEYANYKPDYTTGRYAKGYDMAAGNVENKAKGMTGWCSGCHTTYNDKTSMYNAGDGFGLQTRHRHPVNSELSNYQGPDADNMIIDSGLPLAHDLAEGLDTPTTPPASHPSDWVECLTCHRAHGTSAVMTGWADEYADLPDDEIPSFISKSGTGEPSALLRRDNRGVCEACHNK
ncbi:MAG TPA: cytochrome c3 family protein [Coriobacteriia bacterium]|nr:cytochrome c3 family protein [Coriobacteriia bacterium]